MISSKGNHIKPTRLIPDPFFPTAPADSCTAFSVRRLVGRGCSCSIGTCGRRGEFHRRLRRNFHMFAKLHPRTHRCQSSHLPRNSPNNFGACGLPQVWRYTASHVCPWQCFFPLGSSCLATAAAGRKNTLCFSFKVKKLLFSGVGASTMS